MFQNKILNFGSKQASKLKLISRKYASIQVKELKLKEFGNEENGLELSSYELDETKIKLKPNEMLIKLVAAPVHPADLMEIRGKYGVLPQTLPAIMGIEGAFEVIKASAKSHAFKRGDRVIATGMNWGSWRTHSIADESLFYKIPNKLDNHSSALLKINPVTAYRMLINFRELKPNDTVIQNGANSAVGQAVIQLGKVMNLNIINIVRKRTNQEELNQQLKDLGAKYIFTEEELRSSKYLTNDLWKEIPRPRFALNCVGGKATTDLVRLLDKESIMVTYGGMSKQPLSFNTADFIFKNFKSVGFWVTQWRENNKSEFKGTVDRLSELILSKQLKPPRCKEFKLDEFREAFKLVQTPQINCKVLFVC